jgi:hypothetical protein
MEVAGSQGYPHHREEGLIKSIAGPFSHCIIEYWGQGRKGRNSKPDSACEFPLQSPDRAITLCADFQPDNCAASIPHKARPIPAARYGLMNAM